jgi:quercetin dioxygenase-like cupin family protein
VKNKYHLNLKDIPKTLINHGTVNKKVFIRNEDSQTSLTQFAWSKFEASDICESHSHPTMDEYFFVISGKGRYIIDNEALDIVKNDFIFIPAGVEHQLLIEDKNKDLEIVYFGISTD